MNETEFILFSGAQQLKKCSTTSIDVNGTIVEKYPVVKYLGAYLASCLTMKNHIRNKCRTAMCNIQRTRYIRKSLSKDACVTLMLGLVTSHLDFANALYACLPATTLQQLQNVQNTAAKVVLNMSQGTSLATNYIQSPLQDPRSRIPVYKRRDSGLPKRLHSQGCS